MKKEKWEEKYLVFIPSAGLGYNVVTLQKNIQS